MPETEYSSKDMISMSQYINNEDTPKKLSNEEYRNLEIQNIEKI